MALIKTQYIQTAPAEELVKKLVKKLIEQNVSKFDIKNIFIEVGKIYDEVELAENDFDRINKMIIFEKD